MRFHLVDRISEVVPEKRIKATKLVSLLDPVLEDHPSAGTILAPSVVLEAMNQTAAWLAMATTDFRKRLVLGALREIAVEGAAPVGERLDIAVEAEDWSDDAVSVNGAVSCRGEPVLRVEGGLCFFIDAAELEDPEGPGAVRAVVELGSDSGYYVMVRGWLAIQLQADLGIVEASGGNAPASAVNRVEFLQQAIRAIGRG